MVFRTRVRIIQERLTSLRVQNIDTVVSRTLRREVYFHGATARKERGRFFRGEAAAIHLTGRT